MAVGEYIGNGNPDGTSFGQSGEKISFYGATPVTQQASGAAAPTTTATAIATTALATVVATATDAGYGFTTTTDGQSLLARVTALIATVNVIKARVDDLTTSYNTTVTALEAAGILS